MLQRLVYDDHALLRSDGAQAVGAVQGHEAHLHRRGPLARLSHLVDAVADAVDLRLVAVGDSSRRDCPIYRDKETLLMFL